MWNETLELHAPRRLEQNDSVALQLALEPRPEIFDIGCSDHPLTLLVLLERRRELADSSDDIRTRCQREAD